LPSNWPKVSLGYRIRHRDVTLETKEMNRRLIELAEDPKRRFWRLDYDALSEPERTFRAIWELEAEVNNGGFRQFFLNDSGGLVLHAVNALRRVEAHAMADIVQRAVYAVGSNTAWSDNLTRQAKLRKLSNEVEEELNKLSEEFFSYPDNLTTLLYRYV